MGFALTSSSTTRDDILKLHLVVDYLGDEISKYAQAAWVSKEFLLNVMTRVKEIAQQGSSQAIAQADRVENLLAERVAVQLTTPHSPINYSLPPSSMQTPNWAPSVSGAPTCP